MPTSNTEIVLTLPRPHPAQAQIIREAARFNVLSCGRRFGKSTLGLDQLIKPALAGLPGAWFAPNYRYEAEMWRTALEMLQPVTAAKNEQEKRIELFGDGTLDFWSLDSPDAGRGRKYAVVVVDEAAIVPNLETAWQQSIRATLTDLRGSAWFLSTPKSISGYFHSLYQRGLDPTNPDWRSWQMPTAANPYIDAAEIEAARRDLADLAFHQEYLAEFVSWEGAVFRKILDAVLQNPEPPIVRTGDWREQYMDLPEYRIGVDWARSAKGDYTVFCVVSNQGRVVEIDRFRGMEYSLQRARLGALRDRWRAKVILAESNSIGQPVIEQLRQEGIPVRGFTTTNATKARIIEALALAFEREQIKIPNDPVLIGELQAYEAVTLPASGLTRYSAPDGGNDDIVVALALAWEAKRRGVVGEVSWSPV